MGDRFDSMRARGINTNDATATAADIVQGKTAYVAGNKITGSLVPSGGSGELNVYVQSTEPTSKNGIWIDDTNSTAQGDEDNVMFLNYANKKAEFVNPNQYTWLKQNYTQLGQIYYSGYLYTLGTGKAKSYKIDLNTRQIVGQPEVPTITSLGKSFGAVEYEGNIFVFYYKSDKTFAYYVYHPATDTYENEVLTSLTITESYVKSTPVVYENKAYMWCNYLSDRIVFDLENKTVSKDQVCRLTGYPRYIASSGHYLYFKMAAGKNIIRQDILTGTKTSIGEVEEYGGAWYENTCVYIVGNYLYLFGCGTTADNYYRLNITNNNIERIYTNYSYFVRNIPYGSSTPGTAQSNQYVFFDDTSGKIYIRQPGELNSTYVLQIENPPNISGADDGTILLTNSFDFSKPTQMIDDIGIITSVDNTYIVKDGEASGGHFAAWGDGTKWNVIKNLNSKTCTVSFDTDGGSGTFPSVQVLAGESPNAPSGNPSKSGNVFKYWTLNGNEFNFGSDIVVSNVTLVAAYEPYEEVDYIQSTGTQYIDTGVAGNNIGKVECSFAFTEVPTWSSGAAILCSVIASENSSDPYNPFAIRLQSYQTNKKLQFSCGSGTGTLYNSQISANTDYTAVFDCSAGNFTVNGTTQSMVAQGTGSSNSTYLFADNANGTTKTYGKLKLYSMTIYNSSNVKVREFVPIKLTSTNEFCLLDKVNNVAYHNAGTGAFIGDGYEPTQLEYIESTGKQYIDTGIKSNQDTNTEISIKLDDLAGGSIVYTVASSGTNYAMILLANGNLRSDYGSDFTEISGLNFAIDTLYTLKKDGKYTYLNNTLVRTSTTSTFTNTNNITLLGRSSSSYIKAKLYSCTIYNGGTKVRDFVPAKDYNDVVCLWDKVSQSFFYNAGTGTFTGGSVVS